MTIKFMKAALSALFISVLFIDSTFATERFITIASTTSTQNSGLFNRILPVFEKHTGIEVRVVAVGTGQALRLARNGDADVLLVHHKPSEVAFVKDGYGVNRFDVMYNDFVIIGPKDDPAKIFEIKKVELAFSEIAKSKNRFVSRGDDSGTHKQERSIWQSANIDPLKHSGKWYQEIGAGMGAALNSAAAKSAYTLSDRGTWLSFKNKSNLTIVLEGDKNLLNPYGIILVNPKKHPHVKVKDGQAFIDWLISSQGQKAIDSYKINGERLFFPNAKSDQPAS